MTRFVPICIVLSLLLAACADPPVAEERFVVTPEPGLPAFTEPATPSGTDYPAPPTSGTGYPAPATAGTGYPGPTTTSSNSADGRSESALTSYERAAEVARNEYDPEAQLYGIVPSGIMLTNLGNPPVLPGWFYKFKREGSRREFIVQVVDEVVTGTTIAEPMQELQPAELPIDLSQVKIDSPQVLEQFEAVAAERNLQTDGVSYDLELVSLEGSSGPVWSVVDPATKEWLYSISAANGNEVPNPHQ